MSLRIRMRLAFAGAVLVGVLAPGAGLAQDAKTDAEPAQPPGKAVYEQWCVVCHGEGRYMAGTAGLQTKYKGEKPALLEERTDLTPEVVKAFVRNGVRSMAPFRKTEITDEQLEDLAAYLSRDRSQ